MRFKEFMKIETCNGMLITNINARASIEKEVYEGSEDSFYIHTLDGGCYQITENTYKVLEEYIDEISIHYAKQWQAP